MPWRLGPGNFRLSSAFHLQESVVNLQSSGLIDLHLCAGIRTLCKRVGMLKVGVDQVIEELTFTTRYRRTSGPVTVATGYAQLLGVHALDQLHRAPYPFAVRILHKDDVVILQTLLLTRLCVYLNQLDERIIDGHFVQPRVVLSRRLSMKGGPPAESP